MARRNRERNSSDTSIAIPDGIKLTAASEQQWNRLVVGLPLERGPRLLFVTLDSPTLRRPLASDLAKNLTQAGVAVEIIDLNQPLAQPLQEILRQAQERPKANAYFVLGLDRSLLSTEHSAAAFADLNFHREHIPQAVRAPLVFWLDTSTFKSLALRAPDFMAWRAGEFHLVEDEGPMSEAIQRYRQHVIDRFSKLTLYSVTSDKPLAVDLEQVFVRLITQERAPDPRFDLILRGRPVQADLSAFEDVLESNELKDLRHWFTEAESVNDASLEATASWEHENWLNDKLPTGWRVRSRLFQVAGARETVSFGEATARHRELSIIGAPGSGKTTALKYLGLTFARRQALERLDVDADLLPVYIALRDFNNILSAADIKELEKGMIAPRLFQYFDKLHSQLFPHLMLPAGFFETLLKNRRCILLLDGLDEVADSARRALVAFVVLVYAVRFKGNRFVLTSRPRGYESSGLPVGRRFVECTIKDFDDEQIKSYAKSWYLAVTLDLEGDTPTARDHAATRAEDLLRAVQNDRVRPLATNPLLLSILALIHQRGNRLPQRRVALYEECIEFLLGFWRQVQGGDAARKLAEVGGLTRNEKRTLLEPVALWMHERGESGTEVTRSELEYRLADEFRRLFSESEVEAVRRASEFVDIIVEHAGLLVEREAGIFAFSHLTFQEFLAARALSDRGDYLEVVQSHLHNPWWREVILLLVGYLSSPCTRRSREETTEILNSIRNADSPLEEVLRRDLLFAFRCLCDVEQLGIGDEVRRILAADILELYRATKNKALAYDLLELFAYAAPTPVGRILTSSLLVLVEDLEAVTSVRCIAVQALGVIGGAAPSPEILTRLLDFSRDTDESIRNSAAEALASLGRTANTPQVVTRLLEMIQETRVPPLAAADALSIILLGAATPEVLLRLVELIRDPKEAARVSAVHALGRVGTEAPTTVIARLVELSRDAEAEVRARATDALGRLGKAGATPEVLCRLVELSRDPEPHVRYFVAQALGDVDATLRNPEALSSLVELSRDPVADVRSSAIQALGRIAAVGPSLDVLGRLMEMSQSPDGTIRAETTHALGALAAQRLGPGILARLIELTRDPEVEVRRRASLALRSAGVGEAREKVIPILIGLIQDSEVEVSWAAGNALGMLEAEVGTSKVLATLVKLTRDRKAIVRASAVHALGRIGTAAATGQVLRRLVDLISDDDKEMRLSAAEALVRLGATNATAGLLTRMSRLLRSSEDSRARANLAMALGQANARLSHQQLKQLICFWQEGLSVNAVDWFGGSYRQLTTVAYEQLKELAAVALDARHKAVDDRSNLGNTLGTTADVSIAKKRSSLR